MDQSQQPFNAPLQQSQQPTNTTTKSNLLLILIGIILLILVGGIMYLLGSRSQKPTVIAPTPIITPFLKPTNTSVINDSLSLKTFKSIVEGLTFKYPDSLEVDLLNKKDKYELCDLHLLNPAKYPQVDAQFTYCEASPVKSTGIVPYDELLVIYSKLNKANESGNPPIRLQYYENPENLSLEGFKLKYPDLIGWSNTLTKKVNSYNVEAYYNDKAYCVALCQEYIFKHGNKIYILRNFPSNIENQIEIFNRIFNTLSFNE